MVTWSVICFTLPNYLQIIFHSLHITHLLAAGKRESLLMDPPQVHASSHRTVFIVAHYCSTITHPRTDRTALTHPQTDRNIVSTHPQTITTVTRSDHLYLMGPLDLTYDLVATAFLSLKLTVIASLFLRSHQGLYLSLSRCYCLNPLFFSQISLSLMFQC